MVRMDLAQPRPKARQHLLTIGMRAGQTEHVERPRDRIRERACDHARRAPDAREVADERRAERSVPSHGFVEAGRDGMPREVGTVAAAYTAPSTCCAGEPFVSKSNSMPSPTPTSRWRLLDRPTRSSLEAMPESGLHDAVAELDVADQTMEIGKQIRVEVIDVRSDDRSEQDAAEPGRGIGRQRAVTERDAPRRRERARMPDDQLGQNGQEVPLTRRDEAMTAAQSPARRPARRLPRSAPRAARSHARGRPSRSQARVHREHWPRTRPRRP